MDTILLLSTPLVDDSAINSIHRPIEYVYHRADYQSYSGGLSDDSGNLNIVLLTDTFDDVNVGDFVWLGFVFQNEIVEYTYVEVLSGGGIGVNNITVDYLTVNFPTNNYAYVNRNKENFRVEFKIETNLSVPNYQNVVCVEGADHYIRLNVAPMLKHLVNFDIDLEYDQLTFSPITALNGLAVKDDIPNLDKITVDQRRSIWSNGSNLETDYNDDVYYINGILTKDIYKQNFKNFTTYIGNSGKWLHKTNEVIYFEGYPFSVDIISVSLTGYEVQIYTRQLDKDGNTVNFDNYSGVASAVFQKLQRNVIDLTNLPSNVDNIQMWFGLRDITLLTETISEVMTIKRNTECVSNGIYLRWLLPNGGLAYWLFKGNQINNLSTANELSFSPYNEEIDEVEVKNRASNKINVGTVVEKNQLSYLLDLYYSIRVWRWTDEETWEIVRIEKGSFKTFETIDRRTEMFFTILENSINIQSE